MKMKRIITGLLFLTIFYSLLGGSGFAENEFNEKALSVSSRYQTDGDFWSIAADYVGVEGNTRLTVSTFLSSTYVEHEWGPELRVAYRINNDNYEVTAFRATINGEKYLFENLSYNPDSRIQAGYMFGGTVYETFMKKLPEVKTASFQVEYKDASGNVKTASIGHVHTGDLANLISVSRYYMQSNAFSTDKDPAWSDSFYGASIK